MADRSAMLRRGGALAAAAFASALGGCSFAPPYARPDPAVPVAYPEAPAAAPAAPAALDARAPWRQVFGDPRLVPLIETALANNRDLQLAALNIEQTRAQFGIERAALFPAVDASASALRGQPSSIPGQTVMQSFDVGLGFTAWELDLFGRLRNLKDAALARYLASAEARDAVQASLVAAVANGWLTLLADDDLLEITRQTLATREESLRLTQLRFEQGVASELDLRLARSLAETARATDAQQRRQRRQDENALALLLGAPVPPAATEVSTPMPATPPAAPPTLEADARALLSTAELPDIPPGLPADLLTTRPDIRAAEQRLVAANFDIGAARAAFFPRIALTTSVGTTSREFSDLFGAGSKAWTLAPFLTLPLFDGGRNRATLEYSEAARAAAVADYQKTVQSAFREVADALAGRATLGVQLEALRATAEDEAGRVRLSEMLQRNGVASALDVLDAQRSLYGARQATIGARLALLQNRVLLYRALGGGGAPEPGAVPAAPIVTGAAEPLPPAR